MKLQVIFTFITILSVFQVQGAGWNYRNQGNDWKSGNCYTDNNNEQSPINLVADAKVNVTVTGKVSVAPGLTKFTQTNNGHTIVLNYEAPKEGEYFLRAKLQNNKGETHLYDAIQFHFHASSEHSIEGKYSPLELHIVCARTDGTTEGRYLAVLGFLFNTDATSDQVDLVGTVNEHISIEQVESTGASYDRILAAAKEAKEVQIDMQAFFKHVPFTNSLYHYDGGLTTPGCSELVNWYVNKNIVRISENQLIFFRQLWVNDEYNNEALSNGFGNNRALQDLGSRKIYGGKYSIILETTESYQAVQDETNLIHRNVYIGLSVVLMLFVFFYGIFFCYKCCSMTSETAGKAYVTEDSPSKKVLKSKSPKKIFTQGNTDE